jgi:hypothetical protein
MDSCGELALGDGVMQVLLSRRPAVEERAECAGLWLCAPAGDAVGDAVVQIHEVVGRWKDRGVVVVLRTDGGLLRITSARGDARCWGDALRLRSPTVTVGGRGEYSEVLRRDGVGDCRDMLVLQNKSACVGHARVLRYVLYLSISRPTSMRN